MAIEETDPGQVRIGWRDGHVIVTVNDRSVALDPATAERLAAGLLGAIERVSDRRYTLLGRPAGEPEGAEPSAN